MSKSEQKLFIARELQLPLEAVTQTFGILAIRGAGKTNTGVVMMEEMLERSQHVVAIDPTGVMWGIRSKADGKGVGFPIPIFGGEKGDLPLHEEDGEMVASAIIENRFSAILDLSNFRKNQSTRFMTAFAETLYQKQAKERRPIHLMIDEADSFAPQRPFKGQERMLGAMEDIVRKGRSRGMGCTMISQRPAVLNKNVLTQIEVLIVLRIISPQDRDAIDAWLEVNVQPDFRRTVLTSLAELSKGQAWVWSPSWLRFFDRVQIRMRATFDSSATPTTSEKAPVVTLAEIDLKALGDRIAQAREKAKTADPKHLQAEMAKLKQRIHQLEHQTAKPVKPEQIIPADIISTLEHGTRTLPELMDICSKLQEQSASVYNQMNLLNHYLHQCLKKNRKKVDKVAPINVPKPVSRPTPSIREIMTEVQPMGDNKIGRGELKILQALAWNHPTARTRAELGTLAGYAHSGGSFNTYLSRLRVAGLIVESNGVTQLSEEGVAFFKGDMPAPPGSSEDIQNMWLSKLGGGEGRLLKVLIGIYPQSVTRDELAEKVDPPMEPSGGSFNTYLSRLRCNNLIEDSGRGGVVKASSSLFI